MTGGVMSAAVGSGGSFVAGAPRLVVPGYDPPWAESPRYFDLAADGRLLLIKRGPLPTATSEPARVVLVQNWIRAVERATVSSWP
jgi:hypothetical protein